MTRLLSEPLSASERDGATMQGSMLWFNEEKDYGFISTEEGERLYVHGTGFAGGVRPKGRCAGILVSFRVTQSGEERRAEATTVLEEVAPRRARRHHGASRGRS
jgi:cold shock CspA family protein